MVRFGASTGRVRLAARARATPVRGRRASRHQRRAERRAERERAALGGAASRTSSTTLVFTPDRLAVVKGAPATRRAYLDRSARRGCSRRGRSSRSTTRPRSGSATPRSAVSRSARPRRRARPVDGAVAELGAALVEARRRRSRFSPSRSSGARTASASPAPHSPTRAIRRPTAELDARLDARPRARRDRRRAAPARDPDRGRTGAIFAAFGSQGEQRVAVLALVLAEAEVLAERAGVAPLVLLDDVLSELDGDRRRALAELISGGGPDGRHRDRGGCAAGRAGAAARRRLPARCGPPDGADRRRGRAARSPRSGRRAGRSRSPRSPRAWPAAVGAAIARNAWPLRLGRDGTLHVATSLGDVGVRARPDVGRRSLDRLASELGERTPARLRFRPGPVPEPGPAKTLAGTPRARSRAGSRSRSRQRPQPRPSIDDPELRELVARAARASLARARNPSDRGFW